MKGEKKNYLKIRAGEEDSEKVERRGHAKGWGRQQSALRLIE